MSSAQTQLKYDTLRAEKVSKKSSNFLISQHQLFESHQVSVGWIENWRVLKFDCRHLIGMVRGGLQAVKEGKEKVSSFSFHITRIS